MFVESPVTAATSFSPASCCKRSLFKSAMGGTDKEKLPMFQDLNLEQGLANHLLVANEVWLLRFISNGLKEAKACYLALHFWFDCLSPGGENLGDGCSFSGSFIKTQQSQQLC